MFVTHQSRLLSRSGTSSPPLLRAGRALPTRDDKSGFVLHRPEPVYAEIHHEDDREALPLGPVKETAL